MELASFGVLGDHCLMHPAWIARSSHGRDRQHATHLSHSVKIYDCPLSGRKML
jgi:hypothetical protein